MTRTLGCFVLPHLHVHRGNDEHGLVGGEDQRGSKVISDAGAHLGHQVCRRGTDDDQVGFAGKLDMADLGLVLEVPQRGEDLVAGQRGQRHGRDELRPALGQDAFTAAPGLGNKAHEFTALVGGNTTTHHKQDAGIGRVFLPFLHVDLLLQHRITITLNSPSVPDGK